MQATTILPTTNMLDIEPPGCWVLRFSQHSNIPSIGFPASDHFEILDLHPRDLDGAYYYSRCTG